MDYVQWIDIDGKCPECGNESLQSCPWWDDPPEHGGNCIGRRIRCTECGYTDTR